MGRADRASLHEDEYFRKYPWLYDKVLEHYKDKIKVVNAWKPVDEQLGFEEGNTLFNE